MQSKINYPYYPENAMSPSNKVIEISSLRIYTRTYIHTNKCVTPPLHFYGNITLVRNGISTPIF